MARDVDSVLATYGDGDYSVRLVRGVCKVVPFAPDVGSYGSLAELVKQLDPDAKKPTLDRAMALVAEDGPQGALWISNAVDTADSGISVFTGIKTAVNLYRSRKGERLAALESDQQQAADAILKGLAIAYLIWKLFPGGAAEKVAAFRATPSGQALLFYYAAIEVGLPFADNAVVGGGRFLHDLYTKYGPEQVKKIEAIAGVDGAQGASGVMTEMLAPTETLLQTVSGHLQVIGDAAVAHLPTALDVGDKAAGILATAADAMPVYRWLGARVVAETCARRAIDETRGGGELPAVAKNPALDEVKYTTTKPGRDDIVVPNPPAKRRGCLFFWWR